MTNNEATVLMRKWRKSLGIDNNWEIRVELCPSQEMNGCFGLNRIVPEYKKSLILLLDTDPEVENTLVHELIHILLDGDTASEDMKYNVTKERAINHLADLLVRMKYETPPPKV